MAYLQVSLQHFKGDAVLLKLLFMLLSENAF
jgi:hypothetical protein